MDPELLERITARRAEVDELEERLAKLLAEVRTELDGSSGTCSPSPSGIERVSEQLVDERASVARRWGRRAAER